MIKTVNVTTTIPVRTITPKLNGNTFYPKLKLNSSDILNCMMMRATVDEVLADGVIIALDRTNYNKVNGNVPSDNISIVNTDGLIVNSNVKKPDLNDDSNDDNADVDPNTEAKDPPIINDDNVGLPPHDTDESVEEIETDDTAESLEDEKADTIDSEETKEDDVDSNNTETAFIAETDLPQDPPVVIEETKVQNNNNNNNQGKKKKH